MYNMHDSIEGEDNMTDENPYLKMPADVLTKHLEQFAAAVKGKDGFDVVQMFGLPASISTDDQAKVDQHASLTADVKKLSEAASSQNLSDIETQLARASIDTAVKGLKVLDTDAPVSVIENTKCPLTTT